MNLFSSSSLSSSEQTISSSEQTISSSEQTISSSEQTVSSYTKTMDKIINTFPIYYKIFEKYYTDGTDVSKDLNRLYRPIYTGILEDYSEFMTQGIHTIIFTIESKYNPVSPYAMIDYIEYLFGNVLYETFLSEIKKLNQSKIRYEHLCVFEYIIRVELIKYNLYIQSIKKIEPGTKILVAMNQRMSNCLKKISFSLGWVELNYSTHIDFIGVCKNLIQESNFELEKKIDISIVNRIDSFMKIYEKNTK